MGQTLPMPTAVFDADSHVMETADWLPSYADPGVRDRLSSMGLEGAGAMVAEMLDALPSLQAEHRTQPVTPDVLSGPKGWLAPGALDAEVRSRVLDALDINAQLVFPTFALTHFAFQKDPEVRYGGARALNRGMLEFCARDPRLKPVGFLPLDVSEQAEELLDETLAGGIGAVWVSSEAAGDRSPTHVDLDGVWARLAEAGVPFVLHVGGGKVLPKVFHKNGLPRTTDWLGGGENLRAKDFPVLHHSPERFLACMALDGVFERHPTLRGAAIELGATWVPGLLRNVDYAQRSMGKFEPVLRDLPLKPSEYLRRQVRFTPFPFEDTRWLIDQCGPDLFMFSTDYPHVEGGRHPFERFHEELDGFAADTREKFFWRNGAELLGIA